MHFDQGYYGVADPDFTASVKGFYDSLIEELKNKSVMKLKRDVKRNASKDDAIKHDTPKYLTGYLNSKGYIEEYERKAFKRRFWRCSLYN